MMRTIPNKRLNSDYLFSSYYKIPYNQVDRMCSYKITASFISYFVSYYDNYYIAPQQNEYICNIYADERFDKLYFVKKISANRINSIKLSDSEQMKQIFSLNSYNNNINLRHMESQSFSIRSLYPSYVQMLNKKKYLISILQYSNNGINCVNRKDQIAEITNSFFDESDEKVCICYDLPLQNQDGFILSEYGNNVSDSINNLINRNNKYENIGYEIKNKIKDLQNIGINISDENVVIYYDESYKIII